MNWNTIGHENQKILLENTLKNGNFSHAYLFTGPSMVGKRTLAIEFANKIFELGPGNLPKSKVNPDLIIIEKNQSKIENMRELIRELSFRPYQQNYKIAIIDNFEAVTEEAANSILKTLEEPNASTIIILIASNKKKILPTILSRVQVLHFNRVPEAYGKLFDGKIGKKIEFEQNSDFKEELAQQNEELQKIKKSNIALRLLAIKNYAEEEPARLLAILENWLDQEHFEVISNSPQKYKNLSLISEALNGIKQNFNKKLVLEKLFLNLI
jgi:DNA polymerase-3 subunit delta'